MRFGKEQILHFDHRAELISGLSWVSETGHRIRAIENLGAAGVRSLRNWGFGRILPFSPSSLLLTVGDKQPQDAIDFTDNDIQVLSNFPLSPRIRTLLLARNHVTTIHPSLATSIPNLTNLVLASNDLAELADLDTLANFGRLTHLVLTDNPVAKNEVCAPNPQMPPNMRRVA